MPIEFLVLTLQKQFPISLHGFLGSFDFIWVGGQQATVPNRWPQKLSTQAAGPFGHQYHQEVIVDSKPNLFEVL